MLLHLVDDGPQHKLLLTAFPRRIRATLARQTIVDSERAMLLHEQQYLPRPRFPMDDVSAELLTRTDNSTHCPFKGDASDWTVSVGDIVADNTAWGYESPIEGVPWLQAYVAVEWDRMGHTVRRGR